MKALKRILVSLIAVAGTVNTLFYGGILGNESAVKVDTPSVLHQEEATPIVTDSGDTHSQEDTPTNISSDTASETTATPSPTTPEVTPTNTPTNNETYRILEIGGFVPSSTIVSERIYRFSRATAYNPAGNILYYFADSERAVHAYDLGSNTSSVVMTPEELKVAILGEVETGISNKVDNRGISIVGMAYEQYSGDVYIYGNNEPNTGRWFYGIATQEVITDSSWIADNAHLYFVGSNEYLTVAGSSADIFDFDGNTNRSSLHYLEGYLFEHNESFYYVSDSRISKIGSIYSPKRETVADLTGICGASYHDGYLYTLLNDGIVYKIDIDNNSREPYILPADITQTGRSFLSEGKLTGLIMTNDGGFITYDSSDKKLKYVVPN